MKKAAVQLGVETLVIIALAIIILLMVLVFFYNQFIIPANQLSNYSSNLNTSIPNII
jgi:hypothetical protein